MKVEFRESFDKDLEVLNKAFLEKVFDKIFIMKVVKNIYELNNVKKLKGYKNIYRLRVGDYRLGFSINGNKIILERFLHRKEIYNHFPK